MIEVQILNEVEPKLVGEITYVPAVDIYYTDILPTSEFTKQLNF